MLHRSLGAVFVSSSSFGNHDQIDRLMKASARELAQDPHWYAVEWFCVQVALSYRPSLQASAFAARRALSQGWAVQVQHSQRANFESNYLNGWHTQASVAIFTVCVGSCIYDLSADFKRMRCAVVKPLYHVVQSFPAGGQEFQGALRCSASY